MKYKLLIDTDLEYYQWVGCYIDEIMHNEEISKYADENNIVSLTQILNDGWYIHNNKLEKGTPQEKELTLQEIVNDCYLQR